MDTASAPLSDPEKGDGAKARRKAGPPRFTSFRRGLAFALGAWRPLVAVLFVQLLLALTVAMPFQARVSERLDRHAHAPALAGSPDAHDVALGWPAGLDPGLWADLGREEEPFFRGLTVVLFFTATIAWLFGAVASGGFLGCALDGETRPTAGRFFASGGRHFGRMLRVGLVFAVVVALAGRLVFELWGGLASAGEHAAPSQAAGFWGARLREAVFVVFFLWMRVAADLARADLVLYSRRSAFLAFFRGVGRTIRHPLRTIGLALACGAPAFGLLLLLGWGVQRVTGGEAVSLVGLFLLFQLAVWIRWTSRAALLAGDAHLLERTVRA